MTLLVKALIVLFLLLLFSLILFLYYARHLDFSVFHPLQVPSLSHFMTFIANILIVVLGLGIGLLVWAPLKWNIVTLMLASGVIAILSIGLAKFAGHGG